jgi:hypothetical protein
MTKRIGVVLVFLLGCATGGVSSQIAVPRVSAQEPASGRPRWEHTCRTHGDMGPTALANQLGADGWELVAIRSRSPRTDADDDIYCFKRPKL